MSKQTRQLTDTKANAIRKTTPVARFVGNTSPSINESTRAGFSNQPVVAADSNQRIIKTSDGTIIVETTKEIYINTTENINQQNYVTNYELSGFSGFSGKTGTSGSEGKSGYSGLSGAPAVSGFSGISGGSGKSGFSGLSGWSGPIGVTGDSGFSGWSGPAGGPQGDSGYSGESGSSGFSGWSGPAGGPQGDSGYSGVQGESGTSGYSGQQGPMGPAGPTGLTGESGYSGLSGWSGPAGGPQGDSGYSGISGLSGDNGQSGYSGIPGDLYATSSSDTVDMSTTLVGDDITFNVATGLAYTIGQEVIIASTSTPGDEFSATILSYNTGTGALYVNIDTISGVGTYSSWQVNLKGAPGPQGIQGYSGYSGLEGASGFSGLDGSSGFSGFNGTSGWSGFSGIDGYSGVDGASGFSGFSGVDGYSGADGAPGAEGASGFSGWSGFSGLDGYSGAEGASGFSGADGAAGAEGASGFSGWSGWSGAAGGGGGSVGGTNKQVQFNDSGSFGGAACLTYDSATCAVGMNKVVVPNDTTLDVSVTISGSPAWLASAGDNDLLFQDDYYTTSAYDSTGNLIVIGGNDSYPNVAYLVKYDTGGTVVWKKDLTPGIVTYANNPVMFIDSANNIYCVVGTEGSTYALNLLKIDSSGSIVWQQKIENLTDNTYYMNPRNVTVDGSGNVIIIAQVYNPLLGTFPTIIKVDNTGSSILWQKAIPATAYIVDAIAVTTDLTGDVYVSATEYDGVSSLTRAVILKFDSSGNLVYAKSLVETLVSTDTYPGYLITDSSGNLFATGIIGQDPINLDYQVYIIKFNSSGVLQWQTNFSGGNFQNEQCGIKLDSSGNIYVNSRIGGYFASTFIAKLNSSGIVQWQREFYPTQGNSWYGLYDEIYLNIAVSNIAYAITAYTYAPNLSYSEAVLVQLPTDGSLTGEYVFDSNPSYSWMYDVTTYTTNTNNFTINTSILPSPVAGDVTLAIPDFSVNTGSINSTTQIFLLPGTNIYSFDKNYFSLSDNSNSSLVLKTGTCNRLTIDSTGMTVNGGPLKLGLDSTGSLAIGTGALYCNQNNWGYGLGNVAIGCNTLYCAREDDNIAIGRYAAQCNRDACSSISIGNSAGRNQYYPDKNIAIGAGALCGQPGTVCYANCNIAIGNCALCGMVNGQNNIAIGNSSAAESCSGYGNVVIGHGSGGMPFYSTVVGTDAARHPNIISSVILGYKSATAGMGGFSGCCVINTVSIGTCALYYGNTNRDAVLLGFKAGHRLGLNAEVHSRSVIIGSCAAGKIGGYPGGGDNIIIGKSAADSYGNNIDPYCQNIVIGVCANGYGYGRIAGTGNIVFGYSAAACLKGNENIVIGNCSMPANTQCFFPSCCCLSHCNNIAIGSCSLYCMRGYVAGNNLAIGQGAGYQITTGRCNTIIGNGSAANTLTTGVNNTFLGWGADAATAGASNTITLGNASIACIRAQVTTISALSDARDKTDVEDIPLGLEFILNLRPVKFTWNMRTGEKIGIEDSGFIAQEVAEVEERYGAAYWLDMVGRENPERLELKPAKLIPILVKAVQELAEENRILEQRILTLENKS